MKAKMICSLLCILCVSLSGCSLTGGGTTAASGNYLFMIDEERFDYAEAKIIFMTYECMNESVYSDILGNSFWDQPVSDTETFEDYIKEYCIMPELVCVKALCMMATEQELTLTKDEESLIAVAAKQYYHSLSLAEKKYLNVDEMICYQTFADYYTAHKMMNYLSQSVDSEISDDEARVTIVKELFVTDEEKAKEAYEKLTVEHADFTGVYQTYHENRAIETEEDGTITIIRGTEEKAVEDVIFTLHDDEYSQLLTVDDGYLMILCVDALDEIQTNARKEKIANQLIYDAWYEAYEAYMQDKTTTLNETAYEMIDFQVTDEIQNSTFFTVYDQYIANRT